jgi:excisionase family DNA binding protein
MNLENYLSAKEAARELRISVSALHRLCARGRLASVWIGAQRFVRKDQVRLLAHDVDYQRASRRFAYRGKTLDELEQGGQISLLSAVEAGDGEA